MVVLGTPKTLERKMINLLMKLKAILVTFLTWLLVDGTQKKKGMDSS